MITLEDVKKDKEIGILIETAEKQLLELGYTEHGLRHCGLVSYLAGKILGELGYSEREIELSKIAGFIHDIGNSINREDHAHNGAMLAYDILRRKGMDLREDAEIMMAIGNHDERTGTPVSPISAAVIIADKADVHRSRVRDIDHSNFDIHDKVNYAVEESELIIDKENKKIILNLKIDTEICAVIDYFEIFMERMLMCKKAAHFLNIWFELKINGSTLL